MRIDWNQYPYQTDEDRQFVRLLRLARAMAAVFIIGGIAVVGITSGPFDGDTALAQTDEAGMRTAPGGLMALEAGAPG